MSFGVLGEHGKGVTEHFGVNVSILSLGQKAALRRAPGGVQRCCSDHVFLNLWI